jgi:hypothetical protein
VILLYVHTHLLVLLPYQISLMHGHELFTSADQVYHPFGRNVLCTFWPTFLYACTHIHVNHIPPDYPLLIKGYPILKIFFECVTGPCIVITFSYVIPTRCTSDSVNFIWQLLYMFRASLSSIFRSTKEL